MRSILALGDLFALGSIIFLFNVPAARALSSPSQVGALIEPLEKAGKWDDALKVLQENPESDARYFFNLGTAYLHSQKPGIAVAYLERANRMAPHDSSIQKNLTIAKSNLIKILGEARIDPASTSIEVVADRLPIQDIRSAIGFIGLILGGLWLRSYLRNRQLRGKVFHTGNILGLIGFLFTLVLYGAQRFSESNPPAIFIEPQIIRSGPGQKFIELSRAEPGIKIRVLGPQASTEGVIAGQPSENWWQIRYSENGIGWVPATSLIKL